MELRKKILVAEISDGGQERTVRFESDRFALTAGGRGSCAIRPASYRGVSPFNLLEKKDDLIILNIDRSMDGFVQSEKSQLSFKELIDSGLLRPKNGRYRLEILPEYDLVLLQIDEVRIEFHFETAGYQSLQVDPESLGYAGPLSLKRFKSYGTSFYRSLIYSTILHLVPLIIIMAMPRQKLIEIYEPVYRKARAILTPVKQNDQAYNERIAKQQNPDKSVTLLTMIDSNNRIKGFVRNLFFSKSDSFDFSVSQDSDQSRGGGLFTNIEKSQGKIKKEEIKEIGPLFAPTETKSKINRNQSSGFFSEPEMRTEEFKIEEGTLNRDSVAKVIENGEGALRLCYEEALLRKSGLSVSLVLLLKISESGDVESVVIDSTTLKDKPFEDCVLKKARIWHFPKTEGGKTTIKQPFVFYTTRKG